MLPALRSPEIIFGLCSPIGTDNLRIASLIEQELRQYGYSVINLKVTDIMKDVYVGSLRTVDSPLHRRYDSYIKYANAVRDQFKRADALAMLCSARIRRVRREQNGQPDAILSSKAFILNQFKRKEEVNSLRQVYGKLFVLISVYSDKQLRTERLARMFSEDARSARVTEEDRAHARALVARDEDEEGVRYGQQLRETFPLADLFLDIDDPPSAQQALRKFLAAFFGSNSESPSREEYGMYIAKSASLRSLDLSRQVGAAIFSQKGEVITLGCNEVPKAGGGTYWTGDQPDARDYIFGQDENQRERVKIEETPRATISEQLANTWADIEQLQLQLDGLRKNAPLDLNRMAEQTTPVTYELIRRSSRTSVQEFDNLRPGDTLIIKKPGTQSDDGQGIEASPDESNKPKSSIGPGADMRQPRS